MTIKIGFVKSNSQILLKEVDRVNQTCESKICDSLEIKELDLSLLLFDQKDELDQLQSTFNEEGKFYPVSPANSFGLEKDVFEQLGANELMDVLARVNARWILNNNIKTIEQLYSLITYLKDLWINDRNSFFEELWFVLKTNLASQELTMIFHDLKQPSDAQKEKGEKPKLCYSFVSGNKTPQIFDGSDRESKIMSDYEKEFNDIFSITEFDSSNGRLVAACKIDLSPILIMAKLNSFNQLQQSILIAIFSGLQTQ
jgi:hypothetical protein